MWQLVKHTENFFILCLTHCEYRESNLGSAVIYTSLFKHFVFSTWREKWIIKLLTRVIFCAHVFPDSLILFLELFAAPHVYCGSFVPLVFLITGNDVFSVFVSVFTMQCRTSVHQTTSWTLDIFVEKETHMEHKLSGF
jgi:hypothetical protein